MAAIVLTAAASSGASALGAGTFLAGIAGAAGGYLGGFMDRSIFGGKARINQEGPRLNDLMVQASTYGKVIPLVYGRARIAGNILWARPIEEHLTASPHSNSSGKWGRGSEEANRNEYTYTASVAIALCEGPIQGVMRAWADAKLIELTLDNHTLYLGTEDQLPDTFMSSFHPPGQKPAYRGLAYIVLKNFPLGEFGNRIPNFTFEVNRILKKAYDLEDKIKEITLIPGAGEYVYDTQIQEKMTGELDVTGNFIQGGKATKLNQNTHHNKADVLVALDHLKATLPNVTWVSVVVNWFANLLDPSLALIKPGVEFKDQGCRIAPDEWAVGSFTRQNAHQILKFPDGALTYGGTPTDKSILRLCQELKRRGYKVMLYPMLQMDTITPKSKPWRGRITPKNSKDVDQFFTRAHGYNDFILHYATLNIGGVWLKNNIDAFMIGSELVGLTTHMSSAGIFPAVTELKSLAATIKSAVGSSVKVSYGGDWSEYHSVNGWYHLDPLWSDPNIDMVALDGYFPLTPDLPQGQIDHQAIYEGWIKEEGWEYYYSDPDRQKKVPYSAATYAWKNVKHWWNSRHINPDGRPTAWQPKMKPIWFSELGFPSVDGCSNQPNVFVDPTSVESFYPRGSRGRVDFSAQRLALEASLDYLEVQNKVEAHFVPKKFIWAWDARPFPHFPDLLSVWIDGTNWNTGHWIQGKLGASNLGQIVSHLLAKVGYEANMVDTSRLQDSVSGFVVTNRQSVRACLEQLASSYFFDMVESDGLLKFIKRGKLCSSLFVPPPSMASASHSLDFHELVLKEETSDTFLITRTQELELPRQVDVIYLNHTADYQAGTQSSQRQTVKAVDYATINLPIILNDGEAKTIADVTLYNAWVGRVQYQFTLPPKYALLEPSDVIALTKEGAKHLMRITSTKLMRNGMQEVTAVAEDISSYDFYAPPIPPTSPLKKPAHTSATRLELLDLPAFPTDSATEAYLRTAMVGLGESTRGAILYRSEDGGENYAFLQRLSTEAITGTALNILPPGSFASWDRNTHIDVLLLSGQLESVSEIAVLNGANSCLVGEEVLQFQKVTLLNTHKYRLSCLLRGRLGTEWAVGDHTSGEIFLMLTPALGREAMPSSTWGMAKKYKPVTICHTLSATQEQTFTYCARALKPYAPVHIVGSRNKAGDLTLSWKRRTRLGGEWRDGVDVPLAEESERYEVDIMSAVKAEAIKGGDAKTEYVKRMLTGLTAPTALYTSVQQVTDFGSMQSRITVNVYQLSASVGRGYPGNATL